MDMSERRDKIVELVNANGSLAFARLKGAFPDVSEMTLRTDLKALDEQRRIIRVYGGARSVGYAVGTDDLLANRRARNVAEKQLIASKAAALVRPDTTVFIDSGTTTTALAAVLPDMRLLVFTNSLSVAGELARLEQVRTYVVGGRLNRYSMSLAGSRAQESVRRLTFDQTFLGITAYAKDVGFTCGSDDEAVFKRAVCERASEVVALMDSSKVDGRYTFPICTLADVDRIVSDGRLPSDFLDACGGAGVEVV